MEHVGVDPVCLGGDVIRMLALQGLQLDANLEELLEVQPGVVVAAGEGRDHALGRGLARAPGQWRERRVEHRGPGLHRGHVGHRRHPARAVRVDDDGQPGRLAQRRDQLPGDLGAQQPGGVLYHDVVDAHLDQALGQPAPQLQPVDRADRVAQRALGPALRLPRRPDRDLHVAEVVQGVEDAEDVDPAVRRGRDEELHRVVGVVAVPHQVLAPDQGLYRSVRSRLVQPAQVVPGVLAELQIGLEGRAAEGLHREQADGVQLPGDGEDLVTAEPTAQQ